MRLAERQAAFLANLASREPGADAGVETYRRTVQANWRHALAAAYPVCARLVGEAFFDECAARYAASHPASEGDLHRYGDRFAQFLAAYPHAAALAYLADVARLEWAVHRAGFAADPTPFDAVALAAVPADRLGSTRLLPQHGTALVESAHPIVSIREANQPGRDGRLDAEWNAETAVVHRDGLHVRVSRAGRDARMLRSLVQGEPLERACADDGDAAALPRWVAAGLFSGIAA